MRITTDLLHARAQHTARAIGCPPDLRDVAAPGYTPGTLRLRRDDAGWQLLLIVNDGGGAESLAYALTGREMDAFLLGLGSGPAVSRMIAEAVEGDA